MLYSCVFCGREKKAPDSEVQGAGLFLGTVTRPFPLASSASLLALREKDERRGAIRGTNNKKIKKSLRRLQANNVLIAFSGP